MRSYGQRDPLIEYKKEAFDLFENLLNKLKTDLVTILINLSIVQQPVEQKENLIIPKKKMKRNERNVYVKRQFTLHFEYMCLDVDEKCMFLINIYIRFNNPCASSI